MKLLQYSSDHPEENLAIDEALLDELDTGRSNDEYLRLWEPRCQMVVIGRSSRIQEEVDLEFCTDQGITVLRRCSGGASIVTGPGCLMYAVILDLDKRPELRSLDVAHCFVLTKIREALVAAGAEVEIKGTSDLTIQDRKISGNALRVTRNALLYHGTLLNDFDLELIPKCLKTPPRQPDYRKQRRHEDFVRNMRLHHDQINHEIRKTWDVSDELQSWPQQRVKELVSQKYSSNIWNYKL